MSNLDIEDENLYDEDGYDKNGFNKEGFHKMTGTKYDEKNMMKKEKITGEILQENILMMRKKGL